MRYDSRTDRSVDANAGDRSGWRTLLRHLCIVLPILAGLLAAAAPGVVAGQTPHQDLAAKPGQPAPPGPATTAPGEPRTARGKRLSGVTSWGYQLQNTDPADIAASPFDLVVIDYARQGVDEGRFTPAEVKAMQNKPDGRRRIVLAYLSVGEAEDYRFYWRPNWVEPAPLKHPAATEPAGGPAGVTGSAADGRPDAAVATVNVPRLMAPSWLGRENESWAGNYLVRYWYDGWQEILFHDERSYLSRILDAGFDGVYLDRVDAFYAIDADGGFAQDRMTELVIELAQIARRRKPGFIVVPQNGEELLRQPRYVSAIDGIAKEDLLFDKTGAPHAADRVERTASDLGIALKAGLPVLVVEYVDQAAKADAASAALTARGMLPLVATRALDRLLPNSLLQPDGAPQ